MNPSSQATKSFSAILSQTTELIFNLVSNRQNGSIFWKSIGCYSSRKIDPLVDIIAIIDPSGDALMYLIAVLCTLVARSKKNPF